ncbi:MAG: serine/threonine-protein phosphatase [Lachnospiraceae bacterium]|nr:serine/threonine-protein phosphatase [Lachnospiraceae bacterium]
MQFHMRKVALTDVGARGQVNQDALLIRTASSKTLGRICFALVCDGLGGLSMGEVASAALTGRMEHWFRNDFIKMIRGMGNSQADIQSAMHHVRIAWQGILSEMNERLALYGKSQGTRLGTTTVAFLLIGSRYLVMHVGDSRLYVTDGRSLKRLTHDHSLVQRQLDAGILTPAQASLSDKKSILLQCVGASPVVRPDFRSGTLLENTSVLLCTDGFWRRLHDEELRDALCREDIRSEKEMLRTLKQLISNIKHRGEHDNISVIWLSFTVDVPAFAPRRKAASELAAPC